MEKQLKILKIKVIVWWAISFTSLFTICATLICAIIAWIINNDNLGAISMAICLPFLFSIGFIIGHSVNLNNKKEALIYYIENPKLKSKLFYQLIEKYLRGEIKQTLKRLELKKLKVSFVVLKDKKMDFSVTGKKGNFFIQIVFNKTYFSFYADIDEEENEIKVKYPNTDALTDLIDLVNNEIDKEIKRKTPLSKGSDVDKEILTAKYSLLYNIVKKSIDKWDAIGLIEMGAPNDEYDMEIEQIVPTLYRNCTLEELTEQISKTFTEYFGADTFKIPREGIRAVAKEILETKGQSYFSHRFLELGELEGTCYFEIAQGKYKKCWNKSSLYMTEEDFIPFEIIFCELINYDHFHIGENIDKETADKIITILKEIKERIGKESFQSIIESLGFKKYEDILKNNKEDLLKFTEENKDKFIVAIDEFIEWHNTNFQSYSYFNIQGI